MRQRNRFGRGPAKTPCHSGRSNQIQIKNWPVLHHVRKCVLKPGHRHNLNPGQLEICSVGHERYPKIAESCLTLLHMSIIESLNQSLCYFTSKLSKMFSVWPPRCSVALQNFMFSVENYRCADLFLVLRRHACACCCQSCKERMVVVDEDSERFWRFEHFRNPQ